MSTASVPTKANLLAAKKAMTLAKTGYELMDKKRNVLIREMMLLVDQAGVIQKEINASFSAAYLSLQRANFTLGLVDTIASSVPVDDCLSLKTRSVMGVEVPIVNFMERDIGIPYGLTESSAALDNTYSEFTKVKKLCADLAQIENSVYRLAFAVKKTQRRANSLKNITIPRLTAQIKFISSSLEEKEREDFTRLKVIKKIK